MQVSPMRQHRGIGVEVVEHELHQCIKAGEQIDSHLEGAALVLQRDDKSRHAIDIKAQLHSVRELHAAVAGLALGAAGARDIDAAWLLIRHTKLTPRRLREEWQAVLRVLRPEIAGKLAAVALTTSGPWFSEGRPSLAALDRWVDRCMRHDAADAEPARVRSSVPTGKFFDVWKVLLSAWLRKEGPLAVQEVSTRAGAAYPTVAQALKRLEHRGELRRRSDRSAELLRWPGKTYAEIGPLLPALRKTMWFIDRSGRVPEPGELLRRLHKVAPANIGLGGVEAARRLDREFDLLGTPRIDVSVHVPHGAPIDLDFVRKVDPALAPTDAEMGAILAVHQLTRQQALFDDAGEGLALADPAEIVLDLAELGLTTQLRELVRRFGEAP